MAQYSIIQYVPDVVRAESVNVGVLAFDGDKCGCHFVGNLSRVRALGGNIKFVRDFAERLPHMSAKAVLSIVENWDESIRFTPWRGAILDMDSLIVDAARRFLIDPPVGGGGYRTRASVVKATKMALGVALARKLGRAAKRLIKPSLEFRGKLENHRFDLAVCNSTPLFAIHAISFQIPQLRKLEESVNAVKWAVDDMQGGSDASIVVVMARPAGGEVSEFGNVEGMGAGSESGARLDIFRDAAGIFQKLGAKTVEAAEFEPWASEVAIEVSQHFPGGNTLI